jgi:hypothetical protein
MAKAAHSYVRRRRAPIPHMRFTHRTTCGFLGDEHDEIPLTPPSEPGREGQHPTQAR